MKALAKGRFGGHHVLVVGSPAATAWVAAIFFALGCREGLPGTMYSWSADGLATPPPTAPPAGTFDGTVRYDLAQDDGGRSIQGLAELAARYGVKPYGLA